MTVFKALSAFALMMLSLAGPLAGSAMAQLNRSEVLSGTLAAIESRLGARVGINVLDTHTAKQWSHRADEHFPLTSTFKAFACAGLLARVDAGQDTLARLVRFEKSDLVTYSPVTEKRVGGAGMSIGELCQATMATSDNSAGNMVLDSLGGPSGFTAFMRRIGDTQTRLDRRETELNEAAPGDPRDSTTPSAAAKSLQGIALGDTLTPESRQQLLDWLLANQVGGPLLRASLPMGWRIGDRTGAGGNGSRSIIAVIWPPERKPAIVALYLTGTKASMDERNAAIAEIGGALVRAITE
jgi:beta-lactamase class A